VRSESPTSKTHSRRSLLRTVRNGGLAVLALSAGGWLLVDYVRSHAELNDLTVIGNGIPTVVQIHDPQCPTCRRLLSEMLSAARHFADDEQLVRADKHTVGPGEPGTRHVEHDVLEIRRHEIEQPRHHVRIERAHLGRTVRRRDQRGNLVTQASQGRLVVALDVEPEQRLRVARSQVEPPAGDDHRQPVLVVRRPATAERGLEFMMGFYGLLDRAPKGRDEGDLPNFWIRRHDEYEDGAGASE
jgi:hypothetical protein